MAERKIVKTKFNRKIVLKEIKAAESDLKDAEDSLERKKFKWATIQGYYSMFHAAGVLIFSKGYREKAVMHC